METESRILMVLVLHYIFFCFLSKVLCNICYQEKWIAVVIRGGVEDTRLEAKTKDTKKIPGQEQPFRGQTLSRPRTGMLEAKDRNARGQGQGPRTQPQVFSKKKVCKKVFLGDLQFIGVPRILEWGRPKPQITWNDVIKIFQKRKFLWEKDIIGWKSWNRCLLALNSDFAQGEGLN